MMREYSTSTVCTSNTKITVLFSTTVLYKYSTSTETMGRTPGTVPGTGASTCTGQYCTTVPVLPGTYCTPDLWRLRQWLLIICYVPGTVFGVGILASLY